MKKLCSLVCVCAMVLGMLPIVAMPVFAATSGDFHYKVLADGIAEITDYNGTAINLTIPSTLDGYTVTSIGPYAFEECISLQNVTIPDSVINIGKRAFAYDDTLQNITMSNNVTSIDEGAFYCCDALQSFLIPNSVTRIGREAFFACESFQSITIPDSVTRIGEEAFQKCTSLERINFGRGIQTIGRNAFDQCTKLSVVNVSDVATWCAVNIEYFRTESNFLSTYELGNPLLANENVTLLINGEEVQDLVIPEGVTKINDVVFAGISLDSLTLPASTHTVGKAAFYKATIKKLIVEGRKTYDFEAFADASVDGVYISSLQTWVDSDFEEEYRYEDDSAVYSSEANPLCSGGHLYLNGNLLTHVTFPEGTKSVKTSVFAGNADIMTVTIPDSVTSIGAYAFENCASLESVDLGTGIRSIGAGAFTGCLKLQMVNVRDVAAWCGANLSTGFSEVGVGWRVYSGSPFLANDSVSLFVNGEEVRDLVIPDNVTKINAAAFAGVDLDSLTVPAEVTRIEEGAFYEATISKLVLDGAKIYGWSAFANASIDSVHTSSVKDWCESDFIVRNFDGESYEYFPAANPLWVCGRLYVNDSLLTEAVIPEGVQSVGAYAFVNVENMVSVSFPASLKEIGLGAFSNCTNLQKVYLSDVAAWCEVTFVYVETHVFEENDTPRYTTTPFYYANELYVNGEKVSMLTIPSGVTTVKEIVFYKAPIQSVVLPATLKTMGKDCFATNSLTDVYYGSSKENAAKLKAAVPSKATWHYNCPFATITDESNTGAYASKDQVASVKVTAAGTGLSYTWYVKDPGDSQYYKSSITANTYKVKMTPTTSGRLAYCVVKDQYGNEVRSKTFVLRMKATITSESATGAYANQGQYASVKVTAVGTGLSYAWYVKDPGDSRYYKSSITASTYKVKMTSTTSGRLAYCVVKDQYGNKVQSKTFVLRRKATITSEPATAAYAKKGAKVSVKIGAAGDGLTYTWYIKNANGTKYSKSSITSATYSATMSDTVKGRRIYCVVKDKYGKTAQTKTFILREAVSITTQPKNTTVANGSIAKATVKASGDGLTYTWYIKNAGQTKYTKSSVTKATYSTTMSNTSKNRLVLCIVKDKYGNSVQSTTVQLKMK